MKPRTENLSVALMLAGMTIGSGAAAAEKSSTPWRQRLHLPEHTRYQRKRWRIMRKGELWNEV